MLTVELVLLLLLRGGGTLSDVLGRFAEGVHAGAAGGRGERLVLLGGGRGLLRGRKRRELLLVGVQLVGAPRLLETVRAGLLAVAGREGGAAPQARLPLHLRLLLLQLLRCLVCGLA